LIAIANIPAEAIGKSKRSAAPQSAIDRMRDLNRTAQAFSDWLTFRRSHKNVGAAPP
jgi:hypothetical protein